jgi:hypothetical protein
VVADEARISNNKRRIRLSSRTRLLVLRKLVAGAVEVVDEVAVNRIRTRAHLLAALTLALRASNLAKAAKLDAARSAVLTTTAKARIEAESGHEVDAVVVVAAVAVEQPKLALSNMYHEIR